MFKEIFVLFFFWGGTASLASPDNPPLSITNTLAGELFRKRVNKGKSEKLLGYPNYFLSKYDLLHLVTHEN
jgi:hypothetical protein